MDYILVCALEVLSKSSVLKSKVSLINSQPLFGMTKFPCAVIEVYDTPFVIHSDSCGMLANQGAAALNLPNF